MTPERSRKMNELADFAVSLSGPLRGAYLSKSCGDDFDLRQQVERLIAARESSSDFQTKPGIEPPGEIASSRESSMAGLQVGRFRILSQLGAGGHGEVWLAQDTQLLRKVAIKLLSPDFRSRRDHLQRLYAEARVSSALNHPNIITIYDTGESDGHAFLAQEYVDGETLRRRLDRGALDLKSVAEILNQVAAALSAAHAAGIVHRDIKPENIMIRRDGLVKVLDFGLARFVEHKSDTITRPGLIIGTIRYMSPEQARGLSVDARTDIFSFGAVLYEALTGVPPFGGPTPADTLASILTEEPDFKHVPERFARIVRACLAKDREKRLIDAATIRKALEPRNHALSNRVRVPIAMAAAVALAALSFVAYRFGRPTAGEPFQSMKISLLTAVAPTPDAALSPDGKTVAYFLEEGTGETLWVRPANANTDRRLISTESGKHRFLTFSPDGRSLYYTRTDSKNAGTLYRISVSGGEPQRIAQNVKDRFAFSPDGKQFARVRLDGVRWEESVVITNVDDQQERIVSTRRRPRYFSRSGLAWSPDGRAIVCGAGEAPYYNSNAYHLVRIDAATGAESPIGSHTWARVESLLWSHDGKTLIVAANERSIQSLQIWRVAWPSGVTRRITNDLSNYENVSLSSDGRTLLAVRHNTTSELLLTSPGQPGITTRISPLDLHELNAVAWRGPRSIVYAAFGGTAVNIWSIDTDGRNRVQLTTAEMDQEEVNATRDGRYIVYTAGGRIWRAAADGSSAQRLTPGPLDVHPVATPDSQWVVYANFAGWSPGIGGRPSLWKVSIHGGQPAPLVRDRTSLPDISPDGRFISCSLDKPEEQDVPVRIGIYSAEDGRKLRVFDVPRGAEPQAFWTPDGKALQYLVVDESGSRIMRQSIAGGPPTVAADFPFERLSFIRPSPTGARFVLDRLKESKELVTITAVNE
jgi:Tol biopolymer transport system component/predicted Ser/Thr protein kinase